MIFKPLQSSEGQIVLILYGFTPTAAYERRFDASDRTTTTRYANFDRNPGLEAWADACMDGAIRQPPPAKVVWIDCAVAT